MKRILLFALVAATISTAEMYWLSRSQTAPYTALALQQFNPRADASGGMRLAEAWRDGMHVLALLAILTTGWLCFAPWLRHAWERARAHMARSKTTALLTVLVLPLFGGCVKPYDRPEYVEIDTSDTGFLIPLEGDTTQQARFESEEYLKQRKVAAKRVQITHRWSQEGRLSHDGRWIATVRLVKVNRSPITREWTTTQTTGSGTAAQRTDKAIWIESADSVGFSMGFTCTAFVSEDDASRFLYWYPSGTLAEVMDHEVRGRIQQAAAEVAARYPLDSLRSKKQEIADAVKKDVTNFFQARGVTITTAGMFGGMTYENPEIQKSIDQTFIAQQLKVVSEAKFEAQKRENDRIELEAQAQAEKARREAMGLADARRTAATAEAQAIREISQAAEEASSNPILMQLKAMEVEKARVEKWDGHYPSWYWGNGKESANVMLQVPVPELRK
ncbi:MAG: SPFH domain-containing protein [Verrucomicrobiota bacterium]